MSDENGNLVVDKFKNVYKCDIEQAKKVHNSSPPPFSLYNNFILPNNTKVFDFLDLEGSG